MQARQAVIVIDMLNDFVHGELRCDRADNIIPNLQRLLAGARQAGVPVIYGNDAHLPADFELKVWGEHAMAGTEGARVIPELEPEDGDYQIPKRTYSAFHETGMDSLLRGLGVDTVVITGMHTHICDRHTTADAFFRGFDIEVVVDGVDSFTEEEHTSGLDYLEKIYGARLVSTDELLSEWNQAAA